MTIRTSKEYKEMDVSKAIDIVESEADYQTITIFDELVAWQWLVDNGYCSTLQGFYARTSEYLIEKELIEAKDENR